MKKKPLDISKSNIEVLSSRFLGFLSPASSMTEAESFLENVKKESPKADHYPFAFILDNEERSSDDGEPSGSAGRVLLRLLKENEITGAVLVVARYFGGSKLGLPRLGKTFLKAGQEALKNEKFLYQKKQHAYQVRTSFSSFSAFMEASKRLSFSIYEQELGEEALFKLRGDDTIIKRLENLLAKANEVIDLGYLEIWEEKE